MYKIPLAVILAVSILHQSISQVQVSNRVTENLEAFGRLYGYVKYFHPSDEAAALDWDKFAIYGSSEVLNAKTDNELLLKLQQLFIPIAPTLQIYLSNSKQNFDIKTITPPDTKDFSTIAWQHYGVGLGNSTNIYKSVRINRPGVPKKSEPSFAPISQLLDAKNYSGKQIKMKAWMKVIQQGNEGTGHLWLRVDKEKGMGFFYNMDDRPATSAEWKEYEFEATIDKDGKNIYYGAFLNGRGKLLIDDVRLFVQQDEEWRPVSIQNGSFEEIKDNTPTGWFGIAKRPLYDFSVNNSDFKNGAHSLMIFSEEPDTKEKDGKLSTAIFNQYPKPGEFVRKPLTEKIEAIIPLALFGNKTSTFPEADKTRLTKLKENIETNTKEKKDATDLSFRLANVIIAWNVFKHFFAYWENASQKPEAIFRSAVSKAFKDKSAIDFLETLQLMTAPLNDGHIWVSLKANNTQTHSLPILVDWVENKLVIDKILDSGLRDKLAPGDIIASIDGTNSEEVLKNKEKYLSGSPQWKRSRAKSELFNGQENSAVVLEVERKGKISRVELKRNLRSNALYAARGERQNSGFVKSGIYYIDLDKMPYDSIKNHLTDLKNARGIICDLRGYPANNHQLIAHFLKQRESTKWMFVPEIIYPDYEKVNYSGLGWNVAPTNESLNAKIIFITDGRAISYAESYMGYIKDFKLATIVGQPTAGTNGNVNPLSLPGGYNISWTGMLVKNHDGSQHHLKGIIPDVRVERTVKGVAEGRDEFLEKAIELAEK